MNHIFYIHTSLVGQLGFFQLLAITNRAVINKIEHVPLWHGGASLGYMPKSGISGSSGRSISNFLRKLQIDFQSGCTTLWFHQQWRSVPLSLHPLQHVLSPVVLILAILIGVRWNLRIILFAFLWSLRTLNISLGASQPFEIPQLWNLRLVLHPIF